MTTEPMGLAGARVLLERFEREVDQPAGLVHLSEGLLLLADIRADAESEKVRQVVSNVSVTYARKVQARLELLLSTEQSIHCETVEHFQKVLGEFERCGFALSEQVAETRSRFAMKMLNREIALMSLSEREELLERLERISE
jgi:hypothetical protein